MKNRTMTILIFNDDDFKAINLRLRLKKVLQETKVTGVELADKLGVTQTFISQACTQDKQPSLKLLQDMSVKLNCKVSRLLEAPNGYEHIYNEEGEYLGLVKQSKINNHE